MVQKEEMPRRGRPRAYDPEVALDRAREAFWDRGFSGTSLDDLTERTGMNRPSLYAAFGDKQALYLKTLASYVEGRRAMFERALLHSDLPLPAALRTVFHGMVDFFLEGENGPRGCYMVGTAATEAVANPAVREFLARSQRDMDEAFRAAFAAAQKRGELSPQADPMALAACTAAAVHTIALRARAGQSRAALRAVADGMLTLICPSGGERRTAAARQARRLRKK